MTKPSIQSRLTILFLTLLLLIAPFCLGYLFYVTAQRSYFTSRNFRVLDGIGTQIRLKVDNLSTSLVNAANKAKPQKSPAEAGTGKQAPLNVDILKRAVNQVNTYGSNLKLVSVSQTAQQGRPAVPQLKEETANVPQINEGGNQLKPPKPERPPAQSPTGADLKPEPVVRMGVKPEKGAFALVLSYRSNRQAGAQSEEVQATSDIEKLFTPLVSRFLYDEGNQTSEHLFDELLVAQQSDGKVIFTSGESGVRLVNLTDILNLNSKGEGAKPVGLSSTMLDVEIAGRSYKLFLQPVQLSILSGSDSGDADVRWVVCGLVSSSHLTDQTFAISYTVVIIFFFLLVMALLSMPLLKLKLMGPKDRLTRGNLWSTLAAVVLGTSLLTFLLVDSYTYLSLRSTLDDQLKDLAGRLQTNFRSELLSALNQLKLFNEQVITLAQSGGTTGAMSDLRTSIGRTDIPKSDPKTSAGRTRVQNGPKQECPPDCDIRTNLLATQSESFPSRYPFFNSAVWVDPLGKQRIKWTTRPEPSPFIQVEDRPYFRNVRDDNLWTITDGPDDRSSGEKHSYSLELVNSRNTGENVAIISTSVPGSKWVSCMDTRLLSLVQTVLPAGYGYGIIDNEGRVLFHSQEIKNLEEHFLEECRFDSGLKSALLARTDGFVNTKYLGRGHRLFVTPIKDVPWSLIVFRDEQMLRTVNLEILTLSSILFFGFGLLMLILILVLRSVRSEERLKWLWPDQSRRRRYAAIVIVNLLLGLALLPWIMVGEGWPLMVLTVIVPAAAMLVFTSRDDSKFMTAAENVGDRLKLYKLNWSVMYTLSLTTLLLITSVLPTLAYFKTARDFEMTEFVRHGQMSLARGLEARKDRVKQQYSSIKVDDLDLRKDRFIEECRLRPADNPDQEWRLRTPDNPDQEWGLRTADNSGWDVYSSFFFGTKQKPPDDESVKRNRDEAGKGTRSVGSLQSFLMDLGPLFNQTSVERRGLSRDASADQSWISIGAPYTGMSLIKWQEGDGSKAPIHLVSNMERFEQIASVKWWGSMLGYAILMLVVAYTLVRFVARRVFLLEFGRPRVRAASQLQSQSLRQNLVYIRAPLGDGTGRWSDQYYHVIDLVKVGGETGIAAVAEGVRPGLSIVLDNFESNMGDPAANRLKLDVLERFLQQGRNIIVVSSLSPLSFTLADPKDEKSSSLALAGGSEAATTSEPNTAVAGVQNAGTQNGEGDLDHGKRWTEVFGNFVEVYEGSGNNVAAMAGEQRAFISSLRYQPPLAYLERIRADMQEDLRGEEPSRTELVDEVADRARPIHQAIWAKCSKEEKLTLIHLAIDGLINANSPELRSLMKKGLVVREPALRLVNEAFKRFVILESQKEDFWAWAREGSHSHWELAKVPLLLILVTVAVFLFVTQKEFYDSTMTFLSAVTGGIIALFKLLGLFDRKPGPATES